MNNKMKELSYNVGAGVFGTAHLVFSALAELSASAEIAVVKKTGVWENGKLVSVLEGTEEQLEYRRMRYTESAEKIAEARLKIAKHSHLFQNRHKAVK